MKYSMTGQEKGDLKAFNMGDCLIEVTAWTGFPVCLSTYTRKNLPVMLQKTSFFQTPGKMPTLM